MYFVRMVDENGLFIRDDFVDELTKYTIQVPCPDGFYLPKWDGEKWVEGGTAPQNSTNSEPTNEDRISSLETLALQLGGII